MIPSKFHSTCFSCSTKIVAKGGADDPLDQIWICPNPDCDYFNVRIDPLEFIEPYANKN